MDIYQWYLPNETTLMGVKDNTTNEIIQVSGKLTYDPDTYILTCCKKNGQKSTYYLDPKHIERSEGTIQLKRKTRLILETIKNEV